MIYMAQMIPLWAMLYWRTSAMSTKTSYEDTELKRLITILDRVPAEDLPIVLSANDWIQVYNYLKDLQMYHHLCGKLSEC